MKATEKFFEEPKEQSLVKTAIIAKYFYVWSQVMVSQRETNKIAYIDLFAGPGRYEDGTKSTPLTILEMAIRNEQMREKLVTVFNDMDTTNIQSLENEIKQLPNIEKLKYQPEIWNKEIGTEIVKMFEEMSLIPTLFFVDPWGYKGFSLKLVNAVIKDWGCECVFFFNYNRINMGLNNDFVKLHMDSIFGESSDQLREKLKNANPQERELIIVTDLCKSLNPNDDRYVLPFRFKDEQGKRTKHHLIFVTKHFKGYEIMKDIMSKESSLKTQGVSSFEYNPADKNYPMLFELTRPLEELEGMILNEYNDKSISFKELYEQHSIGKPFLAKHYREVLKKIEKEEKLTAEKPGKKHRKGTFPDDTILTFKSIVINGK